MPGTGRRGSNWGGSRPDGHSTRRSGFRRRSEEGCGVLVPVRALPRAGVPRRVRGCVRRCARAAARRRSRLGRVALRPRSAGGAHLHLLRKLQLQHSRRLRKRT
eukprot:1976563-Pleurochrysis_carterae.AAC.5